MDDPPPTKKKQKQKEKRKKEKNRIDKDKSLHKFPEELHRGITFLLGLINSHIN